MDKLLIALCVVRKIAFDAVAVPTAAYLRYIRALVVGMPPLLLRSGEAAGGRGPAGPMEFSFAQIAVPFVVALLVTMAVAGSFVALRDVAVALQYVTGATWWLGVAALLVFGPGLSLAVVFFIPMAMVATGVFFIGARKGIEHCVAVVRDTAERNQDGIRGIAEGVLKFVLVTPVRGIEGDVRQTIARLAAALFRSNVDVETVPGGAGADRCARIAIAVLSPLSTGLCTVVVAGALSIPAYLGFTMGLAGAAMGVVLGAMALLIGYVAGAFAVPAIVMLPFAGLAVVVRTGKAFVQYARSVADQCAAGLAR